MSEPCPLCHGRRTFEFAWHQPVSAMFVPADETPGPTFKRKTYPCPECSTPQNKIGIARGAAHVIGDVNNKANREHVASEATSALMDFILREGCVQIEFFERGGYRLEATATLAVVTDNHKNLVEMFTKERIASAVEAVAVRAVSEINVWGRDLRSGHLIEKHKAVEFITAAANAVNS